MMFTGILQSVALSPLWQGRQQGRLEEWVPFFSFTFTFTSTFTFTLWQGRQQERLEEWVPFLSQYSILDHCWSSFPQSSYVFFIFLSNSPIQWFVIKAMAQCIHNCVFKAFYLSNIIIQSTPIKITLAFHPEVISQETHYQNL